MRGEKKRTRKEGEMDIFWVSWVFCSFSLGFWIDIPSGDDFRLGEDGKKPREMTVKVPRKLVIDTQSNCDVINQ